jgi:hypothetical protein
MKARWMYGWVNSGKKEVGGPESRRYGNSLGDGLVRDGFFRAQAGVGADLELGEFFFSGWVAFT